MITDTLQANSSNMGIPTGMGSSLPPVFSYDKKPEPQTPGFELKSDGLQQAESKIYELLSQTREKQAMRLPTMLASHVRTHFEAAKTAKMTSRTTDTIDSCLRARKGEYDPNELAKIRQSTPGGSEAFMMITNVKSRACEAILKNALLPAGDDRPWGIDPSPIPDLPMALKMDMENQIKDEVSYLIEESDDINVVTQDQVQNRLDEMRKKTLHENFMKAKRQGDQVEHYIDDELCEGGFYEALAEFLNDVSIYPTAFLKGPIARRVPGLTWVQEPGGDYRMEMGYKIVREYERVSPQDMYPSPGAKNIQDGYVCEHQRLKLMDLQEMVDVPGYDNDALKSALTEYGEKGYREILPGDYQRAEAEGRPNEFMDPESRIDAIEYWGSVQGKALLEWGMDETVITDATMPYQITALLVGKYVVMARVNPHPLGHNPYYAASFSYNNDSLWGESPPMIMRDDQKACNSTARSLFNRMAFASGPIVEIHMDRMMPGEDPGNLRPWMLLKTRSDVNSPKQAVYLTDINPYADIFLKVYQFFYSQASEKTGIPNYVHGTNTDKAAGGTASGMAMMINNMNAMMRNVIMGIDNEVIKKIIKSHWLHLMLYEDDVPKIGDINIRARASDFIIAQEQLQLRRNEALQTTNNPVDLEILGLRGRAKMLRENFRNLKYDEDIVPTDEEMEEKEQVQNEQAMLIADLEAKIDQLTGAAPPGGPGGPGEPRITPEKAGAAMSPDGGRQGGEPARLMQ